MSNPVMSRNDLIRWLDGSWALCFSHPEDFACGGFESDRWLSVASDAFCAAGVRPLVAQGTSRPAPESWFMQVGGVVAQLEELPQEASRDERRVTVFDDSLNARRQFRYAPAQGTPSLLDLVAATWMLRTAPRSAGRSAEARDPGRQDMFMIWRGARTVTSGAARAVQLDAALALACGGLKEVVDQVDRHLVQSVRSGLQRGLQWLGHDTTLDEEPLPLPASRSLNGGW